MNYNVALPIVWVFLGCNLVIGLSIGLYYSKKRGHTLQNYAVGSRHFATSTLVASALSGMYSSGNVIHNVEQTYQLGLYWMLLHTTSSVLSVWSLSPLSLRMASFLRHISVAETIGSVYGKLPRLITALAGILRSITVVAIQIHFMFRAIQICLPNEDPRLLTLSVTFIALVYTALGGIRAVTFTDVLQFLTFFIILLLFSCFLCIKSNHTIAQIIPLLGKQERFQWGSLLEVKHPWYEGMAFFGARMLNAVSSPAKLHKVYMSSSALQARNVFRYATVFRVIVNVFILLIGVFVFASNPALPLSGIWDYILADLSPLFRGILAVSLLSMTFSSIGAALNSCSILIAHDLIDAVSANTPSVSQSYRIHVARLSAVAVTLLGVLLSLHQKDVFKLALWVYDGFLPIVTAPLLLAIFGFRGNTQSVLIGMGAGALSILGWNQWILPQKGIHGSFFCVLVNGISILVAYYLCAQSSRRGWAEPDTELRQMQQAAKRKKDRRKKAFRDACTKAGFAKIRITQSRLICMGVYTVLTTTLSTLGLASISKFYWYILQLIAGAIFLLFGCVYPKKQLHNVPWWVTLCWLVGIFFCLPVQAIFCCWKSTNPVATLALSIAHLGNLLFLLPLFVGVTTVVCTIVILIYPMYCMGLATLLPLAPYLLPVLVLGILVFSLLIFYKRQTARKNSRIAYLLDQRNKQNDRELKQWAYTLSLHKKKPLDPPAGEGAVLEEVVETVTQSIAFTDEHMPLYKQDLQSIIDRFREWTFFLKKRDKSKDRLLLQPNEVTIDELIQHVETMLEAELEYVPRLLLEKEAAVPQTICCDVELIAKLLVSVILHTTNLELNAHCVIKIQLHVRPFRFYTTDPKNAREASFKPYPSIVCVISNASVDPAKLPTIQSDYVEKWEGQEVTYDSAKPRETEPLSIALIKKNMERIVCAHYGQLEFPTERHQATLIVLPQNVANIQKEILEKLPTELRTLEQPATPSQQGDSILELIAFHEQICQISCVEPAVISEILLLLRRCYGYMRHESGQLFYIRAIGIANYVGQWLPHSPKVIYAALLYDLVRFARLPLSYLKANFNLGVWCFVQNILAVDRENGEAGLTLYMGNRLEQSVRKENKATLYVKLSERLYDLEQAEGYANKEALAYMAKETLRVDVPLARKIFPEEPHIAEALETAAKRASLCASQS